MPNPVVHFAIHADDVARAKTFYETVFGWRFEPWGPPNFFQIFTGEGDVRGALEQRQVPLTGRGVRAFTCTIAVEDIEAMISAIRNAGGTVNAEPFTIPSVGRVVQFYDPEGNVASVMQYDPGVLDG